MEDKYIVKDLGNISNIQNSPNAGKNMKFQQASEADFTIIQEFYWDVIDDIHRNNVNHENLGWEKGVYPSDQFIQDSLIKGELYTLTCLVPARQQNVYTQAVVSGLSKQKKCFTKIQAGRSIKCLN